MTADCDIVFVVVGQIHYDIDREYIIIKAFRNKERAEELADGLEEGEISKDKYYIRSEFDAFRVEECELE